MAARELSRHVRLNGLEANVVACRVVQGEGREVHMYHPGRRWTKSRKSLCRSQCTEIASATSNSARCRSVSALSGDAKVGSIVSA